MTAEDTEIYTALGTDEQLEELVSDLIEQYGKDNITYEKIRDLADSQIEQYNHNLLYQFNELVMIEGYDSTFLKIKEDDVGYSPLFYMRLRIGGWYEMKFGKILYHSWQIEELSE